MSQSLASLSLSPFTSCFSNFSPPNMIGMDSTKLKIEAELAELEHSNHDGGGEEEEEAVAAIE